MPRIKQKAAQYRTEDFQKAIEVRKAELGIRTDRELAEMLAVTGSALSRHKREPDKMTVGQLRELIGALRMEPGPVLDLLGVKGHGKGKNVRAVQKPEGEA